MASRRDFLKTAGGLALASLAGVRHAAALAPPAWPPPVGYATISWPESRFADALETISSLDYAGVQMLGWVRDAYSDKAVELKQRLTKLKLEPAALSCSRLDLHPAGLSTGETQFRGYAAFLQKLGGRYLQVMDGGRPNVNYTNQEIASLGERMNALGKIGREYGLTMGYHPHFGTLGETREGLGRVLAATDPDDVKLIADVAHLTLGGSDPAEVIRTYHDRLVLLHFKDLRKNIAAQARQNRDLVRHSKYHFCEIGKGVVDFPPILAELRKLPAPYWIIVELDAYEPPPGGPAESARINKAALEKLGLPVRPLPAR